MLAEYGTKDKILAAVSSVATDANRQNVINAFNTAWDLALL
jgi:hypothetical protein